MIVSHFVSKYQISSERVWPKPAGQCYNYPRRHAAHEVHITYSTVLGGGHSNLSQFDINIGVQLMHSRPPEATMLITRQHVGKKAAIIDNMALVTIVYQVMLTY